MRFGQVGALVAAMVLSLTAADEPGELLDKSVRLIERRQGNVVTVFAELLDCTESTITLDVTMENGRASQPIPLTVDTDGRRRFELIKLRPADSKARWKYSYRFHSRVGGRLKTDPAKLPEHAYRLPYDLADSFVVLQGPNGRFSHGPGTGDENAVDWGMPEGTPVLAARAGTVVGLRQDSTASGPDPKFKRAANYVLVKHDDGTFGDYVHLRPKGVAVTLGQVVTEGDLLGTSGNTGYTDRPHLHFVVFANIDAKTRTSFPIVFRAKDGKVGPVLEGMRY